MLTEERHSMILSMLEDNGSVTLNELCDVLNTSQSTVRRDLNFLAKKNKLVKVHGGAMSADDNCSGYERNISQKAGLYVKEKEAIAKHAAMQIEENDFVYIDAGTTTEKIAEYVRVKNVTFVTNGFINAKKLAQKGYRVLIPAGEIKASTEAIVGVDCVNSLQNYNFTKCFIGSNGVSFTGGMSTPDKSEAEVKAAAISRSREVFVLADSSKFDRTFAVKFADIDCGTVITDKLKNEKYKSEAVIKEVL